MFLIPSLLGLFLFMAPIHYEGDITIPIAVPAKTIQALFGDHLRRHRYFSHYFYGLSFSPVPDKNPGFISRSPFLNGLFNPSPLLAY